MNEEQPPQTKFQDLVQDLDLNTPLHELVGDSAILEQPIQIEPQELERLGELAHEYAQELHDREMLPDTLPMDIDSKLLEPVRQHLNQDMDIDLGR